VSGRASLVAVIVLVAIVAGVAGRSSLAAPAPTISINDVAQAEGNNGNKQFTFTVSLSELSDKSVKVDYEAVNGSATQGSDFNPSSGTLTFDPGQTTTTITVIVRGDTVYEPDETFFVNLSNPRFATISDGQGVGTIVNDDNPVPGLSINDVTVAEGNSGTTTATFTVTLSSPAAAPVTFDIATANGTAVAPGDYTAKSVTGAAIPVGQQTYSFSVTVVGDIDVESDETFSVDITNVSGATTADGTGIGTITNDDTAGGGGGLPSLSISDPSGLEGNFGTSLFTFTVTLSAVSQQQVKVNFATADGSASAGSDYQPTNGQLIFKKGDLTKTVTVFVNGDTIAEQTETFFVNLSNPSNATIAHGQATGTILDDDDAAPSVTSASPADGVDHVATNTNIVVNFSESVIATTNSFMLECPSGTAKTFTVSGSPGSSITLDPTADLPEGTVCTVKAVASQISDSDGNDPPDHPAADTTFSFTTDSAPTVTSTSPANGATAVSPSANVTVTFSEPVNAGGSSFTLECPSGSGQPFGVSGAGTSTITLDPNVDLPAATSCTVTVLAVGISDVDGGDPPDNLAANYVFSFMTSDAAPFVTSASPADGADHVATNANIVVNFSESVTASGSSFTLECPTGTAKSFTVSGSPGSSITLDPTADLPEGTVCTVTVLASGISDTDSVDPPDNMTANYVFSFTTDSAPAVTTTTPADGAIDVDPSANITVGFNEAVNVTTSSFTILCDANLQTFSVLGDGTTAITLDPTADLPSTASCTVTAVALHISDVDTGDPPDHPAANTSFSFTTQDAAPSVTSTSPVDGATGVAASTTVDVTFSESVSATGSAFSLECPTGTPEAFSASASPATTITLTPTANLPQGATCTVTVHKDEISDTDAVDPPDNMAADYVFSFTVGADQAPTDIALSNSSVAENQPSGTAVGTLSTTDPDAGDTFTYSLVSGTGDTDNGSFQIVGDTLETNASFDFETKSSYSIRVRSTDSGSLFTEKVFTISVNDVNEAPTDISLSNNSIDENQPSNTTIGSFTATDPDTGQTHSFNLQSSGCGGGPFADNASFSISGGDLKSAVSFNYEADNSYTICVRTTDNGSPNLSVDKQLTITINDVNDAPVANPDSYSGAIGNTLAVVQTTASGPHVTLTGNSLIANDTDEDATFPHTLTAVPETVTSTGGGTATISSDGSFTFLPGVGDKNQSDTFTYHVTDGSLTTAGTVTVHIDDFLVWYVDNASAALTHDGRSSSPFLNLSSLNGAGGSGDSDGTGDYIFLYQGSGSYGGGIPLEANQKLFGEKNGLTVNGNNLVAAGSTAPVITNASGTGVALANGVDVEGLNISGTSGDGISGNAVTTATVGTTTAVNISSAGGNGVTLDGAATGDITIAAPITGSAGHSVFAGNRTGGTVTFSGAISDTGTGINLGSNTGATINLTGGITASTGTSNAFVATGGGTINVTGASNTVATTTGTALNVTGTTIGSSGLTFRSIASNGGSNTGIILDTTGASGGLTVTGNGTPGSGGTIANKTGADGSTTTGIGIYLKSTAAPSFSRMQLNDFQNFAIRGTSVAGFALSDSTINGSNGNNDAVDEGSVYFTNLTGSASLSSDAISGGWEDNLNVTNTSGTLNRITVAGPNCAIGLNSTNFGNDGVHFESQNAGTILNSTVQNCTFTGVRGDWYFAATIAGGSADDVFANNTLSNTHTNSLPAGVRVVVSANGPTTFNIHDNTLQGSLGSAIFANAAASQAVASGRIENNTVGVLAVPNSGSAEASGIDVESGNGGGDMVALVNGNTVRQYNSHGILLAAGDQMGNPPTFQVTVTNNTVGTPGTLGPLATGWNGIQLNNGIVSTDSFTSCVDIRTNSVAASGAGVISPNNNDVRLRQRQATTVRLPGYLGANNDNAAVQAFLAGQNTLLTVNASNSIPTGGGYTGGAACTQPS
jgi:methionine-rich copper-binding protein CopC